MNPSEVTFVAVLSACRSVELVDEGRRRFDTMSQVYSQEVTDARRIFLLVQGALQKQEIC